MREVRGLTEVDFEIALTALVASLVTTFPTGRISEYPIVKVFAVSLLVLTLVRRLAIINNISTDNLLLEFTTHLLDFFTYTSILQSLNEIVIYTPNHYLSTYSFPKCYFCGVFFYPTYTGIWIERYTKRIREVIHDYVK